MRLIHRGVGRAHYHSAPSRGQVSAPGSVSWLARCWIVYRRVAVVEIVDRAGLEGATCEPLVGSRLGATSLPAARPVEISCSVVRSNRARRSAFSNTRFGFRLTPPPDCSRLARARLT